MKQAAIAEDGGLFFLLSRQLAIFQAVWLFGSLTKPFFAIFFVFGIVAVKKDNG